MNHFEQLAEQALVQSKELKAAEFQRIFDQDPEFFATVFQDIVNKHRKQKKDTAKAPEL